LASYHNRQQRDAEWVIKGSPSSTCAWCKRTLPTLKAHFTLLTLLLDLQEHALRLTLFDELPDKERELFPGKSFLLFSKLPLELRRKIWRATFTPRHVDLSIYDCVVTPRPRWSINIDKHRLPYLPITLSVNRESRAETLQYYCYLFDNHANSSPDLKGLMPPVCFSPRLDSGYISYAMTSVREFPLELGNLVSYIDSLAPGGIGALQRLELIG
jgi:hypothetical protein